VTSVTLVCPPPPAAANTVITLNRDAYGYIAVYTCDIGSVFTEGALAVTVTRVTVTVSWV